MTLARSLAPARPLSRRGSAGGTQLPGWPCGAPSRADAEQHQRTSVAQRALRFPGFGLFGGNEGSNSTGRGTGGSSTSGERGSSTSSTVAAATNSKGGGAGSAPDESPRLAHAPDSNGASKKGLDSTTAASASAESVYEMAAVVAATNGQLVYHPAQMSGQRPAVNGHANGHANRHAQHSDGRLGTGGGAAVADPLRVENNIAPYKDSSITPYASGVQSLAVQIREIASTLRHINTLRVEYMDKIAHQELELETKDQALRSKEDRIHSLESEVSDLRRSLALLHSAKVAAETEVQRLRASANATAALPAPAAAPATEPPAAAASSPALAPAATPTAAPVAPAPAAASAPAAEPAPAAAAAAAAAPAVTPAPPPTPPPPPPPRVPEITVSYRSSWGDVFLHANVDGKGWTALPGLRMEHGGNKEHCLTLQGRSIEFVLTNGRGEWDSPNGANGTNKNYRIGTAGEYRLHNGALVQTKAWQP